MKTVLFGFLLVGVLIGIQIGEYKSSLHLTIMAPLPPTLSPFDFGDNGTLYISSKKYWIISCISVDTSLGIVQPFYDDPTCYPKGKKP